MAEESCAQRRVLVIATGDATKIPKPMKKTPARFVLAVAATLVLVLICYVLARAYLYYEAARAEHMMRELGDVKLGDSEAQVLPILQRYGTWRRFLEPYTYSDKTDYEYMVDFGPSGI